MTVKPTTPLLPQLSVDTSKTSTAPTSRTPAPWTWKRALRLVRHASLYCLGSVIGMAVNYDGFRRLCAAGNVDIAARGRATCVIAAGVFWRAGLSVSAGIVWPRWRNAFLLEYFVGVGAVLIYVLNTIDLC